MIQPDLFRDIPAPVYVPPPPITLKADGRGKRDSSRAAYHAMRDAGQLAPREHEVYAYLCQHAESDFTRAELAKALGRTHGAICGRIFALREYGLVVETARRQCAVTGSQSHGVKVK